MGVAINLNEQNYLKDSFNDLKNLDVNCPQLNEILAKVVDALDQGQIRVAEKIDGAWVTNVWVKQAVLMYLYSKKASVESAGYNNYFDKIKQKFQGYDLAKFQQSGVRVVPPAHARYGSFVAPGSVLMPSYVNIGAYIGQGCMIDTWACVGSCAQIGSNVHISGGVGIGGVLEPIQASPTIIEDNCFIGARSEIVEGVVVEANSVISMGVFIGQSTKIYNRKTKKITYGRVPAGSVVVPGCLPSEDGSHSVSAAIIVKQVTAETRSKVEINELLRF